MDWWFTRGMCILPIFVVVWTYITFGVSYTLSVARGDVDPGFPYISDTGSRRPESCIFGQMLNITAAVALVTLYVRYKQVAHYLIKLPDNKLKQAYYANKIGFVLSFGISFGISLVANFQVGLVGVTFYSCSLVTKLLRPNLFLCCFYSSKHFV